MTEPPETPAHTPAPNAPEVPRKPGEIARLERANRLGRALRDNLRRRKAVRPGTDRPDN